MDNLLQQGINAAKAGDKAQAFQLLTRATQDPTVAEQAWLWLAGVMPSDAERLFCLDNALRINPNNGLAKNKAAEYRQKGIFPAVPMPPEAAPVVKTPAPTPTSRPAPPPLAAAMNLKPLPHPVAEPPRNNPGSQQDLSGLYRLAAQELARKQSPKAVVQKLTEQGVSAATANQIVGETQKVIKKALVENNKKRMTRGLIWMVIGIVLTCGGMAFASSRGGGSYILFWGAIGYGLIDFIAGLIGWLSNK